MPFKTTNRQIEENLKIKIPIWQKSPLKFIKDFWNLDPQPVKPEYAQALQILIEQNQLQEVKSHWFLPFERGRHLTWQQYLIILSIEAAINDKASKRISIASAHGIGKTCSMSLIILWFLFNFYLAQIAVTAPTSKQLFDVLWKELSIWINRMPKFWTEMFEWQSTYIRHKSNPNEWFASAKTAKKDSTEALAGVHGQNVLILADEASGVPDEVFNTMEGSLTEKNVLVILISNPTRLAGYFWETHNKTQIAKNWQHLQFDNISSPIVKPEYNEDIINRCGLNSDEYRIRVLGLFPKEDMVDDKGYTPILVRENIKEIDPPLRQLDKTFWIGTPIMGIDPAGEGHDEARWVIRDQFKAAVVAKEQKSDKLSIARITRTLIKQHNVQEENVFIDSFGIGTEAAVEIVKGGVNINPLNVGDAPTSDADKDLYLNKRARNYSKLKQAILSGFQLVRDKAWADELTSIKERRNEKSKIQIMPKREMRKLGFSSPNSVDALMLTFEKDIASQPIHTFTRWERQSIPTKHTMNNLYSTI